jgi:citrate synthase
MAPVMIAALYRRQNGAAPVAPDPALDQCQDFLWMLTGSPPAPARAEALATYLVTVADHGMNASTFTARVVASTQAGLIAAAVAGLCALKGPLHGGAPGPVLDMLDAIEAAGDPEAWLTGALDAGERLMGFGHRVYRTRDPRADVLKAALLRLGAQGADGGRLRLAEDVEAVALRLLAGRYKNRRLETNVEFYTALLLDGIGLPRTAFTPAFAMGRVMGWIAHACEQRRDGRLIRPASRYSGPMPVLPRSPGEEAKVAAGGLNSRRATG